MDKINNFSSSFNELTSTLERKIMENELLFEITENINKGKNVTEIGVLLKENIESIIDIKELYIVEKNSNLSLHKIIFPENVKINSAIVDMCENIGDDNIVSQIGENTFLVIHGIGISTDANLDFIKDISEHLKLAIEKAKILQMKNEFLAMASHDLKSPISVIKGYISLFETVWFDHSENGKDKQLAIKQMDMVCNKMLRLIDDFIGFTEVEIGKINLNKELILAKDFFDSLIPQLRILGLEKNIVIECEIDDENGLFLQIDKFRMEQVLFNLVSNSIKYSKEHKKIIIHAKKNNDQIIITVIDQGIGMSKTELDKVFNMFQRIDGESNKYSKGSGLGLFIANSIINAHVGRIYADSKIGEGTQISICLPA